MLAFNLLILHWFSSLFCQSFFLHRYCSHKMFSMNFFWERFFYLLTYLTQGASFLNPRTYAVLHNQHHQHSDTESDPHSPIHSENIWQMMLKTYHQYNKILNDKENLKNTSYPTWDKLDRFSQTKHNVILWVGIYFCLYYSFNIEPIYYLLLPLHFLVGPIQGAIVNWFGHKIGYTNFKLPDQSKNTLPIDFLLMGELYQNNHHKHGKRLNFAHKFYEIDLTYIVAYFLILTGIIKPKRIKNEIITTHHTPHI